MIFSGISWADAGKMQITFSPTSDGGGNVYEIDISTAPNLPEWNVANDAPPLSIQSALAIARNELSKDQNHLAMRLATVRLSSASITGKVVVWYYSVIFVNDAKNRRDGFYNKTVNVLMNGAVIKPRKMTKAEYEQWFK